MGQAGTDPDTHAATSSSFAARLPGAAGRETPATGFTLSGSKASPAASPLTTAPRQWCIRAASTGACEPSESAEPAPPGLCRTNHAATYTPVQLPGEAHAAQWPLCFQECRQCAKESLLRRASNWVRANKQARARGGPGSSSAAPPGTADDPTPAIKEGAHCRGWCRTGGGTSEVFLRPVLAVFLMTF